MELSAALEPLVVIVYVLVVVVPLAPTVLAWLMVFRIHRDDRNWPLLTVPLLITTASCLFWFLVLIWSPAWGRDYSNRRFTTIEVNLVADLLMFFLSLLGRLPLRLKLIQAAAAGAVAIVWLYAEVVNSTV